MKSDNIPILTKKTGKIFTVAEVSERLRITEKKTRHLIKNKKLEACKMGRDIRISEAQLNKYYSDCIICKD